MRNVILQTGGGALGPVAEWLQNLTPAEGAVLALRWCQALEPLGDGAERATTCLEDHVTHRVDPPGASGR